MFELVLILTFLVCAGATIWGAYDCQDTLHPLVYLMPAAAFFYVWKPLRLYEKGALFDNFVWEEVMYAQGLYLACVYALAVGCYWGGRALQRDPDRIDVFSYVKDAQVRQKLFWIGVSLGAVGLLSYVYQIANVGGFYAAYSHPKGGGWATSGYLRNLDILTIPAILVLYASRSDDAIPLGERVLIGAFAAPYVFQGLLASRRGPTFLILATLIAGWYLTRRKRPSFPTVIAGGTLIGLLLLALVTFRGQIYLGSDFFSEQLLNLPTVVEESVERSERTAFSNEYLTSVYVVNNSRGNFHYWGTRYLTQLFVRPIPSLIWENKYEEVGMEEIKENYGQLGTAETREHPVPNGAAVTLAASAYVEFAWGAPLFVFLLGWMYGTSWRRCLTRGGLWTVLYSILVACSVFLVAQTFLAVLYRVLLMTMPVTVIWYSSPRLWRTVRLSNLHMQSSSDRVIS